MLVIPPKILASCWLAAMNTLVSPDDIGSIVMTNTMQTSSNLEVVIPTNMISSAASNMQTYNLSNGPMTLSNPLEISVTSKKPSGILKLRDPMLLGSGGGGAVFGYSIADKEKTHMENQSSDTSQSDVVVKISWSGSSESVRNECQILKVLEERGVTSGVEKCLASLDYPFHDASSSSSSSKRAMIVMEPVVAKSAVSSVMDLPTPALREIAVDQLMRTMLQMMAAGIVTTDVQPLISIETGSVLLIDMTEAKVLSSPNPTFVDLALATSFVSEIWNLVPQDMTELASQSLLSEWKLLEKKPNLQWSPEVVHILQDQPLLSKEAADYIEKGYKQPL